MQRRYPVAAMGLLKTRVFLLLGLLLPISWTPLAALGSLLWLIGVPYRVHECLQQVCVCHGGPWACHWHLYWLLVLVIVALFKLHRFAIDVIRSGYRIEH